MPVNTLYFATGNKEKLLLAQTVCAKFGIKVEQAVIEIDEIQGENPMVIVEDKVRRAYGGLSKPVAVSDDSWDIPALRGFPGPYMKSINKWFRPEDFIRLMNGVNNRAVILHQYLAYYDGVNLSIFKNDIEGIITDKPRGENEQTPCMTVTVLNGDNGQTMAEVYEQGKEAVERRYLQSSDVWHKFVKQYVGKR